MTHKAFSIMALPLLLFAGGVMSASDPCSAHASCTTCMENDGCIWVSDVQCNEYCVTRGENNVSLRNYASTASECGASNFSCTLLDGIKDPSFESVYYDTKDNRWRLNSWIEERQLGLREYNSTVFMHPAEGKYFMLFGGHNIGPSEDRDFIQYQLRQRARVPAGATHLSLFVHTEGLPNPNSAFTILIDRKPVFSVCDLTSPNYASTKPQTVNSNKYVEIALGNDIATGTECSFVMNYFWYKSEIVGTEGPFTVSVDFVQFIQTPRTGDLGLMDYSDMGGCSRWCPPQYEIDTDKCFLGCTSCDDYKIEDRCSDYDDTDKKNLGKEIIIIIVVVSVFVVAVLSFVVVFVIVKLRRSREKKKAEAVEDYERGLSDTKGDWGLNKTSLAFSQNSGDDDTTLKDTVTINNKNYDSITVTFKTPKNDAYEISTKDNKCTIKKGGSVVVEFRLKLFCSANINDTILVDAKSK